MISIIDDDQFVRQSLGSLLRSLGYTVAVFASAIDFLESPQLDETACVISDVQMPAMTGVELYRRLTKEGRSIPMILITAYPDEIVRARVLNSGVVGYLGKPFRDDDLMRCVELALWRGKPSEGNS